VNRQQNVIFTCKLIILHSLWQVFGSCQASEMLDKFPDILQFCGHVSRLMVSEIRRRASNQSTGVCTSHAVAAAAAAAVVCRIAIFQKKNLESGKTRGIYVVLENCPNVNSNSLVAFLATLLILLFWSGQFLTNEALVCCSHH